ncbi:MAG TPA: DoxX family protein [Terracidiphilus sp.]|nr:DoxX family protein [Terracidiphilus sp.]
MLVGLLILSAAAAGIFAARPEGENAPKTRMEWTRRIAYWVLTVGIAFEMVAGGIWDLLRIEFVRVSLARLGYPLYLLYILGPLKILGAIALLAPRLPRLKEWAYAGAVINYVGAGASLVLTGRPGAEWVAPMAFGVLTMGSWGLRPVSRKMVGSGEGGNARPIAWCIPVLIVAAMVAVAFVTLPVGAPPQ